MLLLNDQKNIQPSFSADFSFTSSVPSHTFRFIFRVSYLQDIAFIVLLLFSRWIQQTDSRSTSLCSFVDLVSSRLILLFRAYIHTYIHTYTHINTFKAPQTKVCLRDPYLKITYSHIDWYWFVFHFTHTLTNTTEFADSLYYMACA